MQIPDKKALGYVRTRSQPDRANLFAAKTQHALSARPKKGE